MIDFNDVRRESEPTFLLFPRSMRLFLERALKVCQITDCQIMTRQEVQRHLPKDFTIPEAEISSGVPLIEEPPLVFVSHYNCDDMSRKLLEIQHDPDIIRWIDAGCERLMKDIYARRPFA